jgi:8-oxo-dGTP pyrophosphatase MutT (NUDIX family)
MTCLASGIILFRRHGPAVQLLLLRNRDGGHWGFAKGRRAPEDLHEVHNAQREVAEETGYTALSLHSGFRIELVYHARSPDGERYEKRVTYFLAEAPPGEPTLSDEHDRAQWAGLEQARTMLRHEQLRALARAAFDVIGAA